MLEMRRQWKIKQLFKFAQCLPLSAAKPYKIGFAVFLANQIDVYA